MDIKRLRQLSGLTQKEFSERYRIPLKTLQNWESDINSPSARKCPEYVPFLLERVIAADFQIAKYLLKAKIDQPHLEVLEQAKEKIRKSPLAKYVKDVILYGSTARGQAKPSSDVDLLLVLDPGIRDHRKCNDWVTYLKGNISPDDFTLPEADLHVVFDEDWKENGNAYFSNIKREGINVWN